MSSTRAVRTLCVVIWVAGAIACGNERQPATNASDPVAGVAADTAHSACPGANALNSFKEATNVAGSFSNSGTTTSYSFTSFSDENPVGGVPGLIKFCVYATGTLLDVQVDASGADGAPWISSEKGPRGFSFVRPGGNPSNIPLDGTTTQIGTATWQALPTDQAILLHINDPAVCAGLYGSDSDTTCFVKPGHPTTTVCDRGDTAPAYNAMPFGVIDCYKPALGFEAQHVSEFGDEVQLAGTARELVSLKVLFASYACQSGGWNTGDCVSAPGATFSHPITANIYAVDTSSGTPRPGTKLASVTTTFSIPYRPTHADAATCPSVPEVPDAAAGSMWVNPLAVGNPWGTQCQNSISTVLTFDFPSGITLPADVIWTVAFDTRTSGAAPIGSPGPYDSLNVGDESYAGAPYAGTDVDPAVVFIDSNASSGWTGLRPLGAITTR